MSFWEKASALGQAACEKMEKFNADVEHWMDIHQNEDDEKLLKLTKSGSKAQNLAARKLLQERGYDF